MKKVLSILLILVMILGLAACGSQKIDTIEYEDEVDGSVLDQNDPVYAEIESMAKPILQFVEYNHINGNTIDYVDIGAEEFWNIVAIVVSSYENIEDYASIDVAGVYHLKWDIMLDFAKTFLYETWNKNNTPSYRDSYSASADPGSGVIDLIPLGVDNFDASIAKVIKSTDEADYDYVVHVELKTREGQAETYCYNVYLADWKDYLKNFYGVDDTNEHIMPFIVVGYTFEGTNESKN